MLKFTCKAIWNWFFFCRFMITVFISMLVIGLFITSISSWFSLERLNFSKDAAISSSVSILLAHSCSQYSLMFQRVVYIYSYIQRLVSFYFYVVSFKLSFIISNFEDLSFPPFFLDESNILLILSFQRISLRFIDLYYNKDLFIYLFIDLYFISFSFMIFMILFFANFGFFFFFFFRLL